MERLAARGEIAGFTVVTRADVTAAPVRRLMMIGTEGRGTDRILARLAGLPSVRAVHATSGRRDLIAEITTDTLADLDETLARIRRSAGVATSGTNLLLATRRAGRKEAAAAAQAVPRSRASKG
jgi:DNA-binding Lrp family transcriptional regulator